MNRLIDCKTKTMKSKSREKKTEFVDLIEINQGIIHKVARMYCDDEENKKDLFQEMLLQLWKAYPTFQNQSKFTTWMYRVCLNTAITQFKKENKNKNIENCYEIIEIEEEQDSGEAKSWILCAIEKLKVHEKAIIMLYLEEYNYEDIADIIGISISNVGVRINRIKTKLQTILIEQGYGN